MMIEIKPIYTIIVKELHKKLSTKEITSVETFMKSVPKKYKISPRKDLMTQCYQSLIKDGIIEHNKLMDVYFVKLPIRSLSGVLVVTVVLRPDKFSCPYDCHYCPNETKANGAEHDISRSYLSSEPAVMRGMEVDFDIYKQFQIRVDMLRRNGHEIDKVEIIVLGGTFSTYPREYQAEAMRDLYYAANVYNAYESDGIRPRLSLKTEQEVNNETAKIKIIGISLETRPDQINKHELRRFREYGCTRIQIGVQHTNNAILKIINRQHDVECSIKAIKLIKDFGFKLDGHIMPDLPGASPEIDSEMMNQIFTTSKFNFDYLKIYPCLDVKYTEIRKWKETGKWKPYSEMNGGKQLVDLILHTKKYLIPKWIRVNRIQRDFPHEHVNNGHIGFQSDTHKSNLRQLIDDRMKKDGVKCKCIRCREIKNNSYERRDVSMNCITYRASDGIEKFISYDDNKNDKILGFIRLRFPGPSSTTHFIQVLNDCALIRELHVYGTLRKVNDKGELSIPQHNGFGKQLLRKAELLAYYNNYTKVAVISGTGVRNYYKKLGYYYEDTYMIKQLTFYKMFLNVLLLFMRVLGFIV